MQIGIDAELQPECGLFHVRLLQELYATIPIVHIVAVPIDQKITADLYDCPVYVTAARGPTFVFTAGLKTRELPLKWILAGVAALMSIEE